ncbi:hypothetical protein B5M47_03350 [candidate division CPR3 bacterium 4484_211]|uniref:Uncharacterized protein n=1 Tax=candidate division CPR3 bacterium 4484_211 TaxID=1968527 RepID=A0A1W9NYY2_UNCC3|nr:MAG: hypothetical protein B5M47_03350 [candidate division CPR3 bacterium 4484_211]
MTGESPGSNPETAGFTPGKPAIEEKEKLKRKPLVEIPARQVHRIIEAANKLHRQIQETNPESPNASPENPKPPIRYILEQITYANPKTGFSQETVSFTTHTAIFSWEEPPSPKPPEFKHYPPHTRPALVREVRASWGPKLIDLAWNGEPLVSEANPNPFSISLRLAVTPEGKPEGVSLFFHGALITTRTEYPPEDTGEGGPFCTVFMDPYSTTVDASRIKQIREETPSQVKKALDDLENLIQSRL